MGFCHMVVRVATVLFLIATLVVCPLACLGEAVAASVSPDVGSGFGVSEPCSCCAPTKDNQRTPSDPGPGQKSGSCLCHGAVLGDHSADSELHPAPVFWAIPALSASMAFGRSAIDAPVEKHACHFANADSGREVRTLIESFVL
jgi:hypothetical protein